MVDFNFTRLALLFHLIFGEGIDLAEKIKEKEKALEEAKKNAQEARKKADESKKEAEKKRKEAEEAKKKAGLKNPGPGGDFGNGSSGCESRKLAWEHFKSECDRTNGWDRLGSACNDLVRRENGCVDVRQIMPLPDDTSYACRGLSPDVATIIELACKEKQKYMSPAEPEDLHCGSFLINEINGRPLNLPDICSDPAAQPMEGQCTDSGPVQLIITVSETEPGGSTTQPAMNVALWGSVKVYDALGLDGLGLQVP